MVSIGIDFGTTNSLVAAAVSDSIRVLSDQSGNVTTPSVVHIDENNTATVGRDAVKESVKQPERTVFSAKRYFGRGTEIDIGGRTYTPVEIASLVIQRMVNRVEDSLDRSPTTNVVTVPADFDPQQKHGVKTAANMAGLDVDRLITEPVSACLAHGVRRRAKDRILVLDLGGGTFDVSYVEASEGVFEVVDTNGSELGGDDWDGAIFEWLVSVIEDEHGVTVDPSQDHVTTHQLFEAVKDAKEDLSESKSARISVPYVHHDDISRIDQHLTRDQFDSITEALTERLFNPIEELIQEENLSASWGDRLEVDEILLTGGAIQMPQIKQQIENRYDVSTRTDHSPGTSVAIGAVIQSDILSSSQLEVHHTSEVSKRTRRSRTSRSNQLQRRDIDRDLTVIETLPEMMGVVVREGMLGERILPVLAKGQSIPCNGSVSVSTLDFNMRTINAKITMGDPEKPLDEITLDEFRVGPIPPKKWGEPTIEITFSIDRDGLLQITAEILDNNVENEVVIEGVTSVAPGADRMLDQNGDVGEIEEHSDLPDLSSS